MRRFCCLAILLTACASEPAPEAVVPLEPPPPGDGFQVQMSAVAPPNTEIWKCSVYPAPIEGLTAVSWVEFQSTPGLHHLTLSAPKLTGRGDIAYGEYDCEDIYADLDFMENATMFFGSQGGAAYETLVLPDGIAATFPASLDIVHEIHFVNVTDEPVDVYSRINAWTMDMDDVDDGIWGGSVRDEHINLPALSQHTEWSRCEFNRDVEVHFLASHTHELGIEFTIAPWDGTETGEIFYRNDDWHSAQITQYDPPLVVPAGQGFEWACTWDNPRDEGITYGLTATDEMCNLAVVHTPFDVSAQCEVVETSDGVLWAP